MNSNCPPTFNIGPGLEYPTGGSDAFVLKLDPALSSAQFLTYLGGVCGDSGSRIVLEPSGNVWIGGAPSQGFPLVTPYEANGAGPDFVSEFSPDLSQLLFSSYSDGPIWLKIQAARFMFRAPARTQAACIRTAPIAPRLLWEDRSGERAARNYRFHQHEHIESNGSRFISCVCFSSDRARGVDRYHGAASGPATTVMAQLDATGRLPFQVDATSVAFDGYIAPLISVQDNLIVCFAPFEITGSAEVTVTVDGQKSNSVRVGVSQSAPYVLSIVIKTAA